MHYHLLVISEERRVQFLVLFVGVSVRSCNQGRVGNVRHFHAPHLLPLGQPRKLWKIALDGTLRNIFRGIENVANLLKECIRSPFPVFVEQSCKNSVQCTHRVVPFIITPRTLHGISCAGSAKILRTVAPHLVMEFPGAINMALLEQLRR